MKLTLPPIQLPKIKLPHIKLSPPKLPVIYLPKFKFPHFPHIKPTLPQMSFSIPFSLPVSWVHLSLVTALFVITTLNIFAALTMTSTGDYALRTEIMLQPNRSDLHEKLALYYSDKNRLAAEKEYRLAQELASSSSPWENWLTLISQEKKLRAEAEIWEKIHRVLPEYQYASLKLAAFYDQLGEKEKSKEYLLAVQKTNPGAPLLPDFLK